MEWGGETSKQKQNMQRPKVINCSGIYGGEWREHSGKKKVTISEVIEMNVKLDQGQTDEGI